MIKNKSYHDFFLTVYNFYNTYIYDISNFNFDNIYICNSIEQGLIELGIFDDCTEYERKASLGAAILPINNIKELLVLIEVTNNYNREDVMRLIHELTHIHDYIKYANHYTNGVIYNFRNEVYFETYSFFSEMNAFSLDELFSIIFEDAITQGNVLITQMNNQEQILNDFTIKTRHELSSGLSTYNLAKFLGKLYMFDRYNHITDIDKSCSNKYIPMLFHTYKRDIIFTIYKILFSCLNQQDLIFDNLVKVDDLINSIS